MLPLLWGLNDFQPISSVGCIYKIISKVLASRLNKMFPNVIDITQYAFLKGRGMIGSILVANEVVDELKIAKKSGVIVEINFEKTYDLMS